MFIRFVFFLVQQAIEQSQKQHETDVVEKNRFIRMAEDKVFFFNRLVCALFA